MKFPQRQFLLFWLFGISVALLAGFFERPSFIVYDFCQKLTAQRKTSQVVMVLFDQNSVDQLAREDQLYFPFPREILGAAAQVAAGSGAKGVVYDLLFTEPSSHGVDDDISFARLIRDSKIPVYSTDGVANGQLRLPIPQIASAFKAVGSSALAIDIDGITRRFPKFAEAGQTSSAPIDEMIARDFSKRQIQSSPSDRIRFYSSGAIPKISFYQLMTAYRHHLETGQWSQEFDALKDKIWLIGYSAPGLYDLKPTPLDAKSPGVQILATAVENRLVGDVIHAVETRWINGLVALFLALIISCLYYVQTPRSAAVLLACLVGLGPLAISLTSWMFGYWLDPMPLIFGGLAGGIVQTCTAFQQQWRERLKLAKSLEFSMSPEMVELIREGRVEVSRFGERREITIFFCDLAGFTTISEQLAPEELLRVLNDYLDTGASLIIENRGYVDKFIGDAIMAFWGAPIDQPNHALLALESAIAFADRVPKSLGRLSVRIGLHTGEALVGNIGARSRHNYTAIGDSVNLASRLESLCKAYDVNLLVSEATIRATLGDERIWKRKSDPAGGVSIAYEVDHVFVKGRSKPIKVFSFIDQSASLLCEAYGKGLEHYYRGEFADGLRFFESCEGLPPGKEMQARCHSAIVQGTAAKDWREGVWKHESK